MTEPRRVLLPEIESGNAAADRIYRRLIDRRRRLVEPAHLTGLRADAAIVGSGPDDRLAQPAASDAAPATATAEGPTSTHGVMPMTDPASRSKTPSTGGKDDSDRVATPLAGSPGDEAGPTGPARGRGAADRPPAHEAGVFGEPARTGSPRAEIDPEGLADDGSAGFRERDGRRSPPGRDEPYAAADGGGQAWLHPRLSQWQPQSQTMRFIKDHPALAVAIGLPTLLILARNGGLKRVIRYASSPAGISRIRQGMALAATLGLLNNRR